jgi:hypothetical protein
LITDGSTTVDNLKQQVIHYKGQDSSVGTATDQMAEVQFLAGERDYYLLNNTETGSGALASSCPMGTSGCFPSDKAAEA